MKTHQVEVIQKEVAQFYAISVKQMLAKRRTAQRWIPRAVSIYLAKKLTGLPNRMLSRWFGRTDPSVYSYAVRKVVDWMATDAKVRRDVECLERSVMEVLAQ